MKQQSIKHWVNKHPSRPWRVLLGLIPFVIILCLYVYGSDQRKAENPNDKLLPSASEFHSAIDRMVFTPSKRSGKYLFWEDTKSSLKRIVIGVTIAALFGLTVGLLTGAIPMLGAHLNPLITIISLVPPMAILPILFIVFGLGELSKVMLIVIGITPIIMRDMYLRTRSLPSQQTVKALTLGANSMQIICRVMLPQLLPRLIQAVRLTLGSAWLFLIAAEAIAATDGLGYRIFLVRRYLSMDVILPYVCWITLLAFIFDQCLARMSRRLYPWFHAEQQ